MQSPGAQDIFLGAVAGYDDIVNGKTTHLAGVTAKGSTLTIKLAKADPAFLSKISLPFYSAIPKGLPINDKGERYYMDDAQIESGKAQARAEVSQYCN